MKTPRFQDDETLSAHAENVVLREQVEQLKGRVAWFEKQLFGQKSEKRLVENPEQGELNLLGEPVHSEPAAEDKITVTYQRGKAKKQRPDDCITDAGLRFGDEVPIEIISVVPDELKAADPGEYDIIDTKISHKLAQRSASYVVLQYETPVFKVKIDQSLVSAPMPDQVLDSSLADVSLLVGLMVDKFLYHLPLHRQHQRMSQAGITVARSTLTNWVKRAIELLRPIVDAQLQHVLLSRVLAMDETPIKAGKRHKGKLQQAYFWPVYGEDDEVVFTFSKHRGRQHIEKVLSTQFQGTLVTDGYAAYTRYAQQCEGVVHAQCWIHSRRKFVEAKDHAPEVVEEILALIGQLYQIEEQIRLKKLSGEKKQQYRLEHSRALVDDFFTRCKVQCYEANLTPKHPLTKALNYVLNREAALRVFLEDPLVPMDTNHLEREIRPIALGRKNWMFCWTELGAEHVGIIQSLISTCKLQGVNPHIYLTDVLQRVGEHANSRVEELTPRLWKEQFADNPMRSVLDRESTTG